MHTQTRKVCDMTGKHKWGIAAEDYALDDEPAQRKVCKRRGCDAQKRSVVFGHEEVRESAIMTSREFDRLMAHEWGRMWSYEEVNA